MFFATEARAELEQRRAGGPVGQNLTHVYTLSTADKAYLALFGVNADTLLAQMNAGRTIAAEPSARNYVKHWADFSGKIKKPVLTLHTQTDSLVPPSHESAYASTVATAGRSALLAQTFTGGIGHCNFTGQQLLTLSARSTAGSRPARLRRQRRSRRRSASCPASSHLPGRRSRETLSDRRPQSYPRSAIRSSSMPK